MASPSTVPFTGTVPDVDSVIVPCNFDPVCTQLSVNVPENVPPYLPVHLPDSPTDSWAVDAAELTAADTDDTAAAAADAPAPEDGPDDAPPPPQPDSAIATAAPTLTVRTMAHEHLICPNASYRKYLPPPPALN